MGIELWVVGHRDGASWGLPVDEVLECFGGAVSYWDGKTCLLRWGRGDFPDTEMWVRLEDGCAVALCIDDPPMRSELTEALFALLSKGCYGAFSPSGPTFVTASEEAAAQAHPDLVESFPPLLVARDARDMAEKLLGADLSKVWDVS